MKIALIGDVMLGRLVNETLKTMPPAYPWGNTLPLLRACDLRVCNLECVISDRGVPWGFTPKAFHFRSDAKNVECLTAAGIDVVSIANNHTLDYEYEALTEMKSILDRAGIAAAGAGLNLDEASEPALLSVGGITIALIAFTDNEPKWEATADQSGVHYVPAIPDDERAQRFLELVKQTKTRANLVIVSAHWGDNWGYQPPANHVQFGRLLVDAGADIVYGHSPHVVRGIELYRDRPIIYSAGDFIDDYAVDEIEPNDESFLFIVETDGSRIVNLQLHPTVTSHMQAQFASSRDALEIAAKMQQLCDKLGTKSRWNDDCHCLRIPVSARKKTEGLEFPQTAG